MSRTAPVPIRAGAFALGAILSAPVTKMGLDMLLARPRRTPCRDGKGSPNAS